MELDKAGTNRATGGGGGGEGKADGAGAPATISYGGAGAAGSSYSGGSGGGACWNYRTNQNYYGGNGVENGGAGGYGYNGAGPGAGNPSGGTGGLLVIYAKKMINNYQIVSRGSVPPYDEHNYAGCSGGGSINLFYETFEKSANSVIDATGGRQTYRGSGGNGSITKGKMIEGTFIQED